MQGLSISAVHSQCRLLLNSLCLVLDSVLSETIRGLSSKQGMLERTLAPDSGAMLATLRSPLTALQRMLCVPNVIALEKCHVGECFNRSLVRAGVWCGFWNLPRTIKTAERRRNTWRRAIFMSAPHSDMHQTLVQKRSDHWNVLITMISYLARRELGLLGPY